MGLFDKVERGLERAVNSAFAKAFKSEVQPVEIASAIRRAMDDRAAVWARAHDGAQPLHDRAHRDRLRAPRAATRRRSPRSSSPRRRSTPTRSATSRSGPSRSASPRARASRPASSASVRRRPSRAPSPAAPRPRRRETAPPAKNAPVAAPPQRPAASPVARPWLDIDGERYPLSAPTPSSAATSRRHRPRRPGRLAASLRDPRDQRRAAPRDVHPRPRLDERHVRQRRAHHQYPARRGGRDHHRAHPRGVPAR